MGHRLRAIFIKTDTMLRLTLTKAKKRQKNLTREQDQEVIRRNRVDGLSISEIAVEYKRSENAIRDVFKRNGIEWKRVRKKRKERFVDGKAY